MFHRATSAREHTLGSAWSYLEYVIDVANLATLPGDVLWQSLKVKDSYQPGQPTQARVYSLTLGNVEVYDNATDVVIGTIPLFVSIASILFDSGVTHSFISSTFVMLYKLSTEPLEQKICNAIPVGSAVTCRKCVDNCHIVIEGKNLPTKFAVFRMLGFDVILRMDCLSKYEDNIDCRKKEVTFRLNGIKEFKFYGSRLRATLPLLSVVQAIKSVREGAQTYLAYVLAKPEVKSKFEDILVVHHYLDVFAEVTGLPLDQEIEFTIDLVPETQPIYKALYDMAPIELCLCRRMMGLCDYA